MAVLGFPNAGTVVQLVRAPPCHGGSCGFGPVSPVKCYYLLIFMSVRVRLAPSPTGNLHIGTARTGVFNWLFARHNGGKFILRIEDTDLERSRPEYTQNILDGLTWLGLTWDEGPFFQTKRMDLYSQKVQELLDKGLAYRAYDTPKELEAMREAQKARNQAPRYDNRHRHLMPEQQAAFEAEGRSSVIRFIVDDDQEITWNDLVRGKVTWKGRDLGGDMVIARAASSGEIGQPLYNFVVVVDDIDMQISHVIREKTILATRLSKFCCMKLLEHRHRTLGIHRSSLIKQEQSCRSGMG